MGHFAFNLAHFTRILRKAGLPVGPDRTLAAIQAIEAVGLDRRDDVHAALSAVMLRSNDQQPLFDAAFEVFWRDPKLAERMMHMMLPKIQGRGEKTQPKRNNRMAEALAAQRPLEPKRARPKESEQPHDFNLDFVISHSDRERLYAADFESMTSHEFAWAQRIATQLPPPVQRIRSRRLEPARHGRLNLATTMRQAARQPDTLLLRYSRPRRVTPPIVVLLDISGSMDRYARLMLHYLHGLRQRHRRMQVFTFGTRLTPITRALRDRDPDRALDEAAAQVQDWKGGTRIAQCLAQFNREWARRVLGARAAVLLITDGLDREGAGELASSAAHLSRMTTQLVWLNPLLRFDGFEPRAAGVKALLPHVDHLLPMHNLSSLQDLERALTLAPRHRFTPSPRN